jgi:hypothetical protein
MKQNALQTSLKSYRRSLDVAKWNLELHTSGKLIGGKHVTAVTNQFGMDALRSEKKLYEVLVQIIERRLGLLTTQDNLIK